MYNGSKERTKKISNAHTIHDYGERTSMVNFQTVYSVDIVSVSKRGKEEFGRSFKWWGSSFQRSTAMDWIDCFPIFVLMRRLSKLFIGHIVYYNYVIDRQTEDNFEKCLATPFCATVVLSWCPRQMVLIQATASWKWMRYLSKKQNTFLTSMRQRGRIYAHECNGFSPPLLSFASAWYDLGIRLTTLLTREKARNHAKFVKHPYATAVEPLVTTTQRLSGR